MYSGTDIGAAYYRAYSEFRTLLLGDAFRVDLTLRAGDVMIMNNRRILHGRTAFNPTGERHLRGAYCDFDGIASKARALSAAAVTPGSVQGPHDLVSRATATAMWFLQRQAAVTYGEGCTMLSHTLQTAKLALDAGEDDETVLGCLFHDMGHLEEVSEFMSTNASTMHSDALGLVGMDDHDVRGAEFLSKFGFSERVADIPAYHVQVRAGVRW